MTLLEPEGGWYAVLRLPAIVEEQAFTLELLERTGTLVQPGYFFDFEIEPICVLSLLTDESSLRRGLAELVALVEEQGHSAGTSPSGS